ncbi:MAG: prenyltransferase [Bacillota bacterium]|nr:prenyltransferase [Bacillota bacterium]
MTARLRIYFREMFPILPRILLGAIVFGEVHFFILLNYGVTRFDLGVQELVGIFTVFAFYLWLRIADDLKDYETDRRLFAHRALPSGRVYKKDLILACTVVQVVAIALNILYMNNLPFLALLYGYGFLMSQWFFQKHQIQPNLMLALVTHNPVQMIVNLYVISFTVIKYQLAPFSWVTFLVLFTLYFPSLIWEVSRKIRAPKDETEYVTYSKLFGHRKATTFVLVLTLVDILTNVVLIWNLNKAFVLLFAVLVTWMTRQFLVFIKDPTRFRLVSRVELYTYIQEILMLLTVALYLLVGKIG